MDDEAGENFVETVELLQKLSEQLDIDNADDDSHDWFLYDKDGNKILL